MSKPALLLLATSALVACESEPTQDLGVNTTTTDFKDPFKTAREAPLIVKLDPKALIADGDPMTPETLRVKLLDYEGPIEVQGTATAPSEQLTTLIWTIFKRASWNPMKLTLAGEDTSLTYSLPDSLRAAKARFTLDLTLMTVDKAGQPSKEAGELRLLWDGKTFNTPLQGIQAEDLSKLRQALKEAKAKHKQGPPITLWLSPTVPFKESWRVLKLFYEEDLAGDLFVRAVE